MGRNGDKGEKIKEREEEREGGGKWTGVLEGRRGRVGKGKDLRGIGKGKGEYKR
jgi:hypothetical protein